MRRQGAERARSQVVNCIIRRAATANCRNAPAQLDAASLDHANQHHDRDCLEHLDSPRVEWFPVLSVLSYDVPYPVRCSTPVEQNRPSDNDAARASRRYAGALTEWTPECASAPTLARRRAQNAVVDVLRLLQKPHGRRAGTRSRRTLSPLPTLSRHSSSHLFHYQ